jgi:large subunit ribosomal protein L14
VLFPNSLLKVVDNSGGRFVKLLQIPGSNKKFLKVAEQAKVALQDVRVTYIRRKRLTSNQKFYKGLVLTTARKFRRLNGHGLKFESNRAVLFNENDIFLGTRVYGAAAKEIRRLKNFSSIFKLIKHYF